MKQVIVFSIICLSLSSHQILADERICPDRKQLPEGANDLRMQEHEFSVEHALEAVAFLQKDFSKRIWGENAVNDFSSWSGHYISYANSLKFIEGALLKQRVIMEQARLKEISDSAPNSKEIAETKANLESLTKQYCEFLASAEYVD